MAAVRPTLEHEERLWSAGFALVAGVDEVGRGAAAFDLVVCALILPHRDDLFDRLAGVRDSKSLSSRQRATALEPIRDLAVACGIGRASAREIDAEGMRACLHRSMLSAVAACAPAPQALIVDAVRLPTPLRQDVFPKADVLSLSVAAASIVAKETRDAEMRALAERYPGYGFERNVGYLSPEHIAALRRLGPSPLHRLSFLRGVLGDEGRPAA